jgi:hypothetical protein
LVSGVAVWGSGWEEFWFLFRVKGGMIRCFANIYLFCVFFVPC